MLLVVAKIGVFVSLKESHLVHTRKSSDELLLRLALRGEHHGSRWAQAVLLLVDGGIRKWLQTMQAPLMTMMKLMSLPRPILIAIFEFGCYIESHIVFEMCLVGHLIILYHLDGTRLSEKCARYAIAPCCMCFAHRRLGCL